MMGTQSAPAHLFYDFDLDQHVPADHMLRQIDRFLDIDGVRAKLRPFYSHLGRPSIDPELIVRMLVIGYVMGIRTDKRQTMMGGGADPKRVQLTGGSLSDQPCKVRGGTDAIV